MERAFGWCDPFLGHTQPREGPAPTVETTLSVRPMFSQMDSVPASPSHQLCLGELASWAGVFPSASPSLHLVPGDKFPHRANEETGRPEVCRAKYAHVEVALRDANGNPMRGVDLHPGGVALTLEVYAVTGNRRLTDLDIPGHKGLMQRSLLLGPSNKPLLPEVTLTHASSHTFILKVNVLSTDIGMSEMYFRIVPTAPELAVNQNLIVCTPPFVSRARDPSDKKSYRPARNVDFYRKQLKICKQRLRLSQQALAEAAGEFAVSSLRLKPEYVQGQLSEDDSDSE